MRLIVQIGYRKISNHSREGQLVQVWVNDVECSWSTLKEGGRYITSKAEASKGTLWYLWQGLVGPEDTVRLSVKTSLAKIGTDEKRTFEALYAVREAAAVREIVIPGVGHRGYPLLKGRLVEIASVSEQDKRIAELDDFMEQDF
jgi:hypothetical protein